MKALLLIVILGLSIDTAYSCGATVDSVESTGKLINGKLKLGQITKSNAIEAFDHLKIIIDISKQYQFDLRRALITNIDSPSVLKMECLMKVLKEHEHINKLLANKTE